MVRKTLKFMVITLLAYLLQATVAQRIAIGGVAPNLAMAIISVVSVALGRKYTFVMSLTVGYLLEIMLPAIQYFSMIGYPVSCFLAGLAFSDKTERKLEELRTLGKTATQLNPHVRTVLCTLLSVSLFEFVHLFYTYLTGVALSSLPYGRAITAIVYSCVLTAALQFPLRWWLGVYKLPKAR